METLALSLESDAFLKYSVQIVCCLLPWAVRIIYNHVTPVLFILPVIFYNLS